MVDLHRLEARARRTAERGRLRMAARIGLVVVPLACVGVIIGGDLLASACLACLLLLFAGGLRYWHRDGVRAVQIGLPLGLVPLATTVLIRACGVDCAPLTRLGEGEIACMLAGVVAGAGVALRASSGDRPSLRIWGLATGVAAATATLGCVPLGMGGALVTVAVLLATSGLVVVPLRARLTS